ncbi:MAG: glycosyltransferase family 1 protein [Gemmatimonadota bacterium]
MRPLRVLYCTDTYPPQVNGVSVVTALSVDGLTYRGWECGVVAPRYPSRWRDPFRRDEGASSATYVATLPSLPLPIYPDIRLSWPRRSCVEDAIRVVQPDIIHAQTEFVIGRLGAAAALRAGIPLVTSYHTDFGKYADAYGVPALRGAVCRSLARFHDSAARTYTPSTPSAAALRAMGVSNVEVWGRGVDLEIFSPSRDSTALRQSLGLGDAFVFLHVGRLAAEKGVERILSAFAAARERLAPRPVRLVIAGSGPKKEALRLAAPPDTHFLGHLDRTTCLPALYATADAFVFASYTETLGLVILEAMASGLPVVAAPEGGVADHLRNGVNGIAYPAGNEPLFIDALVRLVHDEKLRRFLAVGARCTAEALSWEREMDRLDLSYREVIAEPAIIAAALSA